jgi:hypothetical protein
VVSTTDPCGRILGFRLMFIILIFLTVNIHYMFRPKCFGHLQVYVWSNKATCTVAGYFKFVCSAAIHVFVLPVISVTKVFSVVRILVCSIAAYFFVTYGFVRRIFAKPTAQKIW